MAKCSECAFAILDEHGYSNWTVDGTTVHCTKKLHPDGEFDYWYGEDRRDKYAGKCPEFNSSASPACVDVDREGMNWDNDEKEAATWEPYATKFVTADMLRDTLT